MPRINKIRLSVKTLQGAQEKSSIFPFQFMKMDNWVSTILFSILDAPIIILLTVVDKKDVNSLSGP